MNIAQTSIAGLVTIDHEPFIDERGSFERWWCQSSLIKHGLASEFTQMSISRNTLAGTLRGLHVAIGVGAETKLIRCIRGSVYDVIADVRPDSPTFGSWQGFTLSADVPCAIHVAPGLAHGFITLSDDAEVLYLIDTPYVPQAARTISYRDTRLAVVWPREIAMISERDSIADDLATYVREVRA